MPEAGFREAEEVEDVADDEGDEAAEQQRTDEVPADERGVARDEVPLAAHGNDREREDRDRQLANRGADEGIDRDRRGPERDVHDRVRDRGDDRPALAGPEAEGHELGLLLTG